MSSLRVNIWCDGSWRDAQNVGGAGWVIQIGDDIARGSRHIPRLTKSFAPHGSDIAELTAIAGALNAIPNDSHVLLRLDCQNVIDWLKQGRITTRSKLDIKPLQVSFAEVMSGMNVQKNVDVIKISGANNAYHNEAHKLSREACHRHS